LRWAWWLNLSHLTFPVALPSGESVTSGIPGEEADNAVRIRQFRLTALTALASFEGKYSPLLSTSPVLIIWYAEPKLFRC